MANTHDDADKTLWVFAATSRPMLKPHVLQTSRAVRQAALQQYAEPDLPDRLPTGKEFAYEKHRKT